MLEYAKVNRLLVGLYAPRYGVSCRDVDPANEVRLFGAQLAGNASVWRGATSLAVDFELLHACHVGELQRASVYTGMVRFQDSEWVVGVDVLGGLDA